MQKSIKSKHLINLLKELEHGDLSKIATELGYTRGYVCNVLHGRGYNKEIILKALEIREYNRNTNKVLSENFA